MSKRHVLCNASTERSCLTTLGVRKQRWATFDAAQFVADLNNARFAQRRRGYRHDVAPYWCGRCEGWHTGGKMRLRWHHTMHERRIDLVEELGMRAVSHLWAENRERITAEADALRTPARPLTMHRTGRRQRRARTGRAA